MVMTQQILAHSGKRTVVIQLYMYTLVHCFNGIQNRIFRS